VIGIGVGSTVGVWRGNGVELGEGVGGVVRVVVGLEEGVDGVVGVVVGRWKGVSVTAGLGEGSAGDTEGVRIVAVAEGSTRTAALAVDGASAVGVTSTRVVVGEERLGTGEQPWFDAENPNTARTKTLTVQPSRKVARCFLMRKGIMPQ
jgi:hypothetical protein